MRWLLRCILIVVVLISVAGLARHQWLRWGKGVIAGEARSDQAHSEVEDDAAGNGPMQNVGLLQDDGRAAEGELKHPITRALDQLIDSEGGEELDEDRDSLKEILREGDELLWQAKESNKEAIRQANRQVRAGRSHSPNVVLITIDGLQCRDVGCYAQQDGLTPGIDRLARQGTRMTRFGTQTRAPRWSLVTGRKWQDSWRDASAPSLASAQQTLSHVLWQAGYTTAIIGDCLGWGVNLPDHDFDEWFGFRESSEVAQSFPEYVWSNDRQVPVTANENGRRNVSSQQLLARECRGYFDRHLHGRPFLLCVSLSVPEELADDRTQRVADVDALVGQIVESLDRTRLGLSSLLIVVGTDHVKPLDPDPLIARWPGYIPPQSVCETPAEHVDVPTTIASAVSALYQPRHWEGTSLVESWRNGDNITVSNE